MMKLKTMKDREKIYLGKIIKLIVDSTIIDYEYEQVSIPFRIHPISLTSAQHSSYSLGTSINFSQYCRDHFGLTDEETDFVWNGYKNIIKDKINNEG